MLDKYLRLNIGEKFQCSQCDYSTSDIDKIQNHLLYHVPNDVPENDYTRTQVSYDRRSQQNSNIYSRPKDCASLNLSHFDSSEIANFDKPEKGRNKYQITDNKSKYPSICENREYNRIHGGQFAPNTLCPPRSGHVSPCETARIATNREDQRIFQSKGCDNVDQKASIPRRQERNKRDSDFNFARRNSDSPRKYQGSHQGTNELDEKSSSYLSRSRKHVHGYPSSYTPIPINYCETYLPSEVCLKMCPRGRPFSSDYHVVMERKADVSSERSVSGESRCGSYSRQGREGYSRDNRDDADRCSWHDRHSMLHITENRDKNFKPDSCGSSIIHGSLNNRDRHSRFDKRESQGSLHKHSKPGRCDRQSSSNTRASIGRNSSIERRGGWRNSDRRSSLHLRGRHISRRDRPSGSDGRDSPNRQSNPDRSNGRGYFDRRVNPDKNSNLERRGSSDRRGSLHLRGRRITTDRRERPSGSDGRESPNRQSNPDRSNRRGYFDRRLNPDKNSSLERCGSSVRRESLQFSGSYNYTDGRESHGSSDVRDSLHKQKNHERHDTLGNSHRRDNPDRYSSLERRGSGSSDRRGSLHVRGRHMISDRRENGGSSDINDSLQKQINPQRRGRRRIAKQDRNSIFERRGSCGRRDKLHRRGRHNSNDRRERRCGSDRRETCGSSVRRTILPRHSSSDSLRSLDRNERTHKRERRGSSDTRVSLERRDRYNRSDRRDRRSSSVSRASLHPSGRYSSPDKREKHGSSIRRVSLERQRHIRFNHDRRDSTDRRNSFHLRRRHSSADKSERRGSSNTRGNLERHDERYLDKYNRCSTRNRFAGTANESTKESARKQGYRERFPGTTQPPRRNRIVCYTNGGSESSPRRRSSPPKEPHVSSKDAPLPQGFGRNNERFSGPRATRDCDAFREQSSFNTYNLHETQQSSTASRVVNRGLEWMSKYLFLNNRRDLDASAPPNCKFQELEPPTKEKSEDSLTRNRESPRSVNHSFLDGRRDVKCQTEGGAASGRLEPETDHETGAKNYSKEDDCKLIQSREPENGQSNNTLKDNHKIQVLESSCQTETPYQTYTTDEDLKRQIHNSQTYQQDQRSQCTKETNLLNQSASGYAQIDSREFGKPDYQHTRETLPSCQRNLCSNSGPNTPMSNLIYSHEEYYKNPQYNEAESRQLRARSFHYKHQYIEGSVESNKADKPLSKCPFHDIETAHFYKVLTPEIRFSFCNTRNSFQNNGAHWRPYNSSRAPSFTSTLAERDTFAPQRPILQNPRNHGRASEHYGDPHSGVTTSQVIKYARETTTGLESASPLVDYIPQRYRAGGFHKFSSQLPRKSEQSRPGRGSFTSCRQDCERNHEYARRNPHCERHASDHCLGNFPSPTDRNSYDYQSKHEVLPVFNSRSYRLTNSFTERQRHPDHNSNTRCSFKPLGNRHTHVLTRASRIGDPLPSNRSTGRAQKWYPTDENNRGLDHENILSNFRNSRKLPSFPSLRDPAPSNRITGRELKWSATDYNNRGLDHENIRSNFCNSRKLPSFPSLRDPAPSNRIISRVQKWYPVDEYNRCSDQENALSNFCYSRKPLSYNYESPVHGFERVKFYKWRTNEINQSLEDSKTYFEQNYRNSKPIIHPSIYENDMKLCDVNATLTTSSRNGLRTVDACKRQERDPPTFETSNHRKNHHENGCRKMQVSNETQTTGRWCECNSTCHSANACDPEMKKNVETLKEDQPHYQENKELCWNQDPEAPFTHVPKRFISKEILSTLSNPNFDLTFLRSWKEMLSEEESFCGMPNPNFKTPSYPHLQHRWSKNRLTWNPDNIYSPSPPVTDKKHPGIPKMTGGLSRKNRSTNTDPSLHRYLDSEYATVERFILQSHEREFDYDGDLHRCSECDFETSELCVFKKHKCMHRRRRFYKKSIFADWAAPGHNPL